jgi:uncharacterized membrane protein YdjX (TVP38/TMEM64 family)
MTRHSSNSLRRWLGVGLALLTLVVIGRVAGGYLPAFALWVQSLGMWGPVAFIAGYIVATVAFIPGALMTLAAGAIFGLIAGTVYAFLGETLGGAVAFLISRRLARENFERRLAGTPRFMAIDRAVAAHGRRIIFLLRLSPGIPFNFLNYALGLTHVRFTDYLVASLGMLPGALLYVYYGKLAGDVAAIAGGMPIAKGPGYYALLAVGLIATIVVTMLVTRIARRAVADATAGLPS